MKSYLSHITVIVTTFGILILGNLAGVESNAHLKKEPVVVTDGNWTSTLEGEWMIEFMAPWCPACRAFKEVWDEFATWGNDLDMSVGVIDVTENPGLSGRFLVTSLPTLYHVKEGVFRQYHGSRKTTDLISLIDEKKWAEIEPVTWYRNPNSLQMAIVGTFFKAAMFIRGVYNTMTEQYGIPEWACYVIFALITILTGLLLGLLLVVCCDNFFPAKYIPLPPERIAHRPVVSPDDTDIIDDTEEKVSGDTAGQAEGENQEPADSNEEKDASESSVRKRLPRTENE